MTYLISCEFNMDTACVELKFNDGSMIAIDTIAVENEVADNMYQRSELDWLIYNAPLEYADLILGSVKSFSQKGLQTLEQMKSASNRGIVKGRLQVLHVHVLLVAPLGTGHMAQPGTN